MIQGVVSIAIFVLAVIALVWNIISIPTVIIHAIIYYSGKTVIKREKLRKWTRICLKSLLFLTVVFVLWTLGSIIASYELFGWTSGRIVD